MTKEEFILYYTTDYDTESTIESARNFYQGYFEDASKAQAKRNLRKRICSEISFQKDYFDDYFSDKLALQKGIFLQQLDEALFYSFGIEGGFDDFTLNWMEQQQTFLQGGFALTKEVVKQGIIAFRKPTEENVVPFFVNAMFTGRYYDAYMNFDGAMADYYNSTFYHGRTLNVGSEEKNRLISLTDQIKTFQKNRKN